MLSFRAVSVSDQLHTHKKPNSMIPNPETVRRVIRPIRRDFSSRNFFLHVVFPTTGFLAFLYWAIRWMIK